MPRVIGGLYPARRTLPATCALAKDCCVCGRCASWSKRDPQCRNCYATHGKKNTKCECNPHVRNLAAETTQKVDRPMWNPNGPSGEIHVHEDPTRESERFLTNSVITEG